MNALNYFLFQIFPYIALAVFATTHVHAWDAAHDAGAESTPSGISAGTAVTRHAGPH